MEAPDSRGNRNIVLIDFHTHKGCFVNIKNFNLLYMFKIMLSFKSRYYVPIVYGIKFNQSPILPKDFSQEAAKY